MVFMTFPSHLTEEEELLQQKYAKLRKKKKAQAALRTPKPEKQESVTESLKRPAEAAADATEQAKKLLKLGAIKVGIDKREQQTFKRKRQKDSDVKTTVTYQPFSQTGGADGDEKPEVNRPARKFNLYDNFVGSSEPKFDSDRERKEIRRELPKKGNTLYVFGHGLNEELLRKAFSDIGTITNISMEPEKSCGFVTFEKTESADQAITELNGTLVGGIQVTVTLARHQPNVDTLPVSDASKDTWGSIALDCSSKGTHKDKRDLVTYDDGDIF